MKEDTLDTKTPVIQDWDDEEELPPGYSVINGKVYKPNVWRPGQSGNPAGRPKGKTIKEWVKDRLMSMTDEERDAFLAGIPKETVWQMAEGRPTEDKNISITAPTPILGGVVLEGGEADTSIESPPKLLS